MKAVAPATAFDYLHLGASIVLPPVRTTQTFLLRRFYAALPLPKILQFILIMILPDFTGNLDLHIKNNPINMVAVKITAHRRSSVFTMVVSFIFARFKRPHVSRGCCDHVFKQRSHALPFFVTWCRNYYCEHQEHQS